MIFAAHAPKAPDVSFATYTRLEGDVVTYDPPPVPKVSLQVACPTLSPGVAVLTIQRFIYRDLCTKARLTNAGACVVHLSQISQRASKSATGGAKPLEFSGKQNKMIGVH